jgi:hypothetical protein
VATLVVVGCWGWATQADAFVYWANRDTGTIGRAHLDGSSGPAELRGGVGLLLNLFGGSE